MRRRLECLLMFPLSLGPLRAELGPTARHEANLAGQDFPEITLGIGLDDMRRYSPSSSPASSILVGATNVNPAPAGLFFFRFPR